MNKRKKLGKVISNVSRIMLVTILTLLTLTILNPRADAAGSCSHQNCKDKVVTPASCTTAGLMVTYCYDCYTQIDQKPIPALGHAYGAWKTTKEATCTAFGTQVRSCTRCNNKQTDTIAKKPHKLKPNNYPATCITVAYSEITCTECGYVKETVYDEGAPLGDHTYGAWERTKEPTCTKAGTQVRSCTICGYKQHGTINKLKHSYGTWKRTKEPTCTADGEQERSCTRCNKIQTKSIAKLGHNYETIPHPATCTTDKYSESKCTRCGFVRETFYDEGSALGHSEGAWERTKEPTCTKEGLEVIYCKNCGTVLNSRPIPAGHKLETIPHPATCTTDRYAERKCTRCGVVTETVYDEGTALGHKYGAWKTTKKATCIKDGLEVIYCKNCGTVLNSRPIPAGHTLEKNTYPPTCTTDGYAERKCTRCGVVTETFYDEGTALGHECNNWTEDYEHGIKYGKCTRCKKPVIEKIDDEKDPGGEISYEALFKELSDGNGSLLGSITAEMDRGGCITRIIGNREIVFNRTSTPFGTSYFHFGTDPRYEAAVLINGKGLLSTHYYCTPLDFNHIVEVYDPIKEELIDAPTCAWDISMIEGFNKWTDNSLLIQFTLAQTYRVEFIPSVLNQDGTLTGYLSVNEWPYHSVQLAGTVGLPKSLSDDYTIDRMKWESSKPNFGLCTYGDYVCGGIEAVILAISGDEVGAGIAAFDLLYTAAKEIYINNNAAYEDKSREITTGTVQYFHQEEDENHKEYQVTGVDACYFGSTSSQSLERPEDPISSQSLERPGDSIAMTFYFTETGLNPHDSGKLHASTIIKWALKY